MDPDDPGNLPWPEEPEPGPTDPGEPGAKDPEGPVEPAEPVEVEPIEPAKVDKSVLQAAVDAACGLEGNYTEESWGALVGALSSAQAVLADEEATQAEADNALAALNSAIAGLLEVELPPEEQPAQPAVDVVITADQMAYAPGIQLSLPSRWSIPVT